MNLQHMQMALAVCLDGGCSFVFDGATKTIPCDYDSMSH